jgi:hypothetical protein
LPAATKRRIGWQRAPAHRIARSGRPSPIGSQLQNDSERDRLIGTGAGSLLAPGLIESGMLLLHENRRFGVPTRVGCGVSARGRLREPPDLSAPPNRIRLAITGGMPVPSPGAYGLKVATGTPRTGSWQSGDSVRSYAEE